MKQVLLLIFLALVPGTVRSQAVNRMLNGDFSAPNPEPARIKDWSIVMGSHLVAKVVDSESPEFKKVLSVTLYPNRENFQKPWMVSLAQGLQFGGRRGTPISVRLWLRSPERLSVRLSVKENKPPATIALAATFQTTNQWKEYEVHGRAGRDFNGSDLSLTLMFGYANGSVEIADVRLVDRAVIPKELR